MDFLDIKQLAALAKVTRRTLDRRLDNLKANHPEVFKFLTHKPRDRGKILYDPRILAVMSGTITPSELTPEQMEARKKTSEQVKAKQIQERVEKQIAEEEAQAMRDRMASMEGRDGIVSDISAAMSLDKEFLDKYDAIPMDQREEYQRFAFAMQDFKSGHFGLLECMVRNNIEYRHFWEWIFSRPIFEALFEETYQKSRKAYNIIIRDIAKANLKKLITGHTKVLETVRYHYKMAPTGKRLEIPIEKKTQEKWYGPSPMAIIFALTNRNPEDWLKVFKRTSDGRATMPNDELDEMTDEALWNIVEEARAEGLLNLPAQNVAPKPSL